MATYYALTSVNAQMSGWSLIADGTNKDAVREQAYHILRGGVE